MFLPFLISISQPHTVIVFSGNTRFALFYHYNRCYQQKWVLLICCKLWWSLTACRFHPPSDLIIVVVKKKQKENPSQNIQQYREKDGAETQTNWQPQDEQDQTANSEQVGHCGLEKGQFILVNRWPFKLDIECCWGAEVYQCPCPAGSELIPRWYSWCCEQSWESNLPLHTTNPSLLGSKAITI